LAAVVIEGSRVGLAFVDISTGEFYTTQFEEEDGKGWGKLRDELAKFRPKECLVSSALDEDKDFSSISRDLALKVYPYETSLYHDAGEAQEYLKKHFKVVSMEAFGVEDQSLALKASGVALNYLYETQKTSLEHINKLTSYSSGNFMILDPTTLRNLEILSNVRDGSTKNTLLSTLDATLTPMGTRTLRKWALQPLIDVVQINKRLEAVDVIYRNTILRHELNRLLKPIGDLERLVSRIVYGTANPKELIALKNSLKIIPQLKELLESTDDVIDVEELKTVSKELIDPEHIVKLIEESIVDDPPGNVRDGGVIREGHNHDLDELRRSRKEGKEWISELENMERRRTGIRSLKVGYNQVFGYYIEVTKSHLASVPGEYIRKQTLSNAERFITPELKDKEEVILGAEEKIQSLEQELYREVLNKIADEVVAIQRIGRETALVVLMAQLGSFVPVKFASIGVVDRIFTRVGAFDDLTSGQSTFMVEMLELANILNSSTPRSLILLDEIGRGTSTFDGLSIAWSVAEYIHNIGKKGVKTMFATHYHQLTELTASLKKVKNYHIAVKEEKDEITFLRKVVPGATDKSYGIQVAKLAGLPKDVIARSKEILAEIEAQNIEIDTEPEKRKGKFKGAKPKYTQVLLLGDQEDAQKQQILKELSALKLDHMTPMEALQKLQELKKKFEED